jgi:cell division protein FtsL
MQRWLIPVRKLLLVLLAGLVLTGVSLMYLQPDFMVMMSNQLWSCF